MEVNTAPQEGIKGVVGKARREGRCACHGRSISYRDKRRLRAGFEDAIRTGINRATRTLRNVEGAWVKDMNVLIDNGNIKG